MIKNNGRNISPIKISSTIKAKIKINSYYYYIQIYFDSFTNSQKITFLIKTRKEAERKSILYKRAFNYNELINYNKRFKNFSSIENIFKSIAKSIEENKYYIKNELKCLCLIIGIYIRKLKKDVIININLNQHKNLHPLSLINKNKKETKTKILGIQNEEELSYAIYDIRQRLKNLEMQTIINNNLNNNNNNLQKYINNSMNLSEYMNNNVFQIKTYNNRNLNKRNINNKIGTNSNFNTYNDESILSHQNNSFVNLTNKNYFYNNSNNLFPKNLKLNQKNRISGVNELIKKINILETKTSSKNGQTENLDYKLNYSNYINNDVNLYKPKSRTKKVKNNIFNKSVEINKRNDNPLFNLYNDKLNNNITQIRLENPTQLNTLVTNEKSFNGSQMIENKNINGKIEKNKNKINKNFSINLQKFLNKNKEINNDKNGQNPNIKIDKIKNINNDEEEEDDEEKIKTKQIYDNGSEIKVEPIQKEKIKKKYNNKSKIFNEITKNENINNNLEEISEEENKKNNGFISNRNTKEKISSRNNVKIKDNSNINYKINNSNNNNDKNSLASRPIIMHNYNRSISSSMSDNVLKIPKKVPIYSPEKLKDNLDSNIIFRQVEINLLKNKLSNNSKKINVYFNLLYRATRDGDNDSIIKKLTLGYENVITLFYTNEGARFGIFIKRKKNHYIKAKDRGEKTGTCFIFGLNNLVFYDIYKNKYGKGDYNKVLCFGCLDDIGSNGTKWMIYTPQNNFLNKKCVMSSGIELFNDIDIEQIVGPSEYTIKEVEIFNVEKQKYGDSESDSDSDS